MEKRGTITRRHWTSFVAIALAMVMLILPYAHGTAQGDPIDVTRSCSLTVKPSGGGGTDEFADDIGNAKIVIDLYKVADAEKMKGYDTYIFTPKKNTDGSEDKTYGALFNQGLDSITNRKITSEEWRNVGQNAAAIALKQTPDYSGQPLNTPIEGLSCGLYLVIARDKSGQDYVKTLDNGKIATTARSDLYEYYFEPELVAFPTKDPVDGTINTANEGPWLYDLTISMKAERKHRKGKIRIIKSLDTYESKDPASFVFQVEGTFKGKQVFSNTETISFTEENLNPDPIVIDGLWAGTEVTVTEVYSGNDYKVVTDESVTKTVIADEIQGFPFTNEYNDEYKGGGSIVNQFDYNSDISGSGEPVGWEGPTQKKDK